MRHGPNDRDGQNAYCHIIRNGHGHPGQLKEMREIQEAVPDFNQAFKWPIDSRTFSRRQLLD